MTSTCEKVSRMFTDTEIHRAILKAYLAQYWFETYYDISLINVTVKDTCVSVSVPDKIIGGKQWTQSIEIYFKPIPAIDIVPKERWTRSIEQGKMISYAH